MKGMERMRIELHLLQNFAPANLNRDDTGAPKDCELGGYRRARVSSQCQKRAVRDVFRLDNLLSSDQLGVRTKRLVHEVARELEQKHGHARDAAAALAVGAIEGVGLGRNKKGSGEDAWKTEYLLFVPRRIVSRLAALLDQNREKLVSLAASGPPDGPPSEDGNEGRKKVARKQDKRDTKQDAKAAYPKEVGDQVAELLEDARSAADVALFGRMIADKPSWNVDAACQVAHAISTNRVQMDFDFFTAVDDFKPGETAGSDMMGTVQFNSSCFYRYAVLNVAGLRENLGLDEKEGDALAQATVSAFVRAFVSAIPTGKQNSMAAHNFPSYVLAVVRDAGQPVSLTNAFLKPARPRGEDVDLVDDSIAKLEDYFGRMRELLGDTAAAVSWADRDLPERPQITRSGGLAHLIDTVTSMAFRASS